MDRDIFLQLSRFPTERGNVHLFDDPNDLQYYTATAIAAGTAAIASEWGGGLLISGAATTDNSGSNLQGPASFGLNSKFGQSVLKFAADVQMSDALNAHFTAGYAQTDANTEGGVTNGIYFRKLDGTRRLFMVIEKAGAFVTMDTGVDLQDGWRYQTLFTAELVDTAGAGQRSLVGYEIRGYAGGGDPAVNAPTQVVTDRVVMASALDIAGGDPLLRPTLQYISGNNVGTKTCLVRGVVTYNSGLIYPGGF